VRSITIGYNWVSKSSVCREIIELFFAIIDNDDFHFIRIYLTPGADKIQANKKENHLGNQLG
jgi:hypothetical protein